MRRLLLLLLRLRRSFSTAAATTSTSTSTSLQWRRSLELQTLASQVSSLLLHRRRFPSPSLLRVLSKLRSHPLIALRFFRFAVSNLAFAPDLRSHAAILQILVDADLLGPARVILDPAIRSEPSAAPLLDSVLRSTTYAAGHKQEGHGEVIISGFHDEWTA
ncbi:uncharacterized protein LOC109715854 [Ananas comosus]|uniref:Uncharacterized protein LOC109715854 n=1 Tax=Ananas comosus TaxID=4615 RepID=A0A6P5FU79_ANACO|nr:uncharacterized protein LOC109715854 [Ananas comosus]XP_020096655.1 uncharacterized protein LOC109715854 [Ananas comosus]